MSEGLRPAAPSPSPSASPSSASGAARPEVPGYDLLEKLGEGGMGEVFLARQRSLDREVALKVVRRDGVAHEWFLERLEREARILARLRNPHLVTVHDFVRLADGSAAVVMELVEGGNLRDRLRAHPGGLPLADALAAVEQAGAALEAAHAQGVVHRDIKPENLLVDGDGRIRVSDFGMALSLSPDSPRLTRTGTAAGTPGYLAPEQVSGGRVDVRTDVYALGVVLYELLTGRLPLGRFEAPRRLRPETPPAVESLLLRALDPVPARRPQTVAAFLGGLRDERSDSGTATDAAAEAEAEPTEVPAAFPEPEAGVPVGTPPPEPPFRPGPIRGFPGPSSEPAGFPEPELPPPPFDPDAAAGRERSRRRMLATLAGTVVVAAAVKWLRPGRWIRTRRPDEEAVPWRALAPAADPMAAAISGTWRTEDGALVSGPEICLIPLLAEMPPAWNLRLVVTRLGGSDSAAVFFRHPSGFGTAELDGWSSHRSGVQAVDGVTTQSTTGFNLVLEPGVDHELELSVRPEGVRMSVDGRAARIYPLAGRRLTTVAPWNWPDGAPTPALALGSYRSPMRFSRIRWIAAEIGSP